MPGPPFSHHAFDLKDPACFSCQRAVPFSLPFFFSPFFSSLFSLFSSPFPFFSFTPPFPFLSFSTDDTIQWCGYTQYTQRLTPSLIIANALLQSYYPSLKHQQHPSLPKIDKVDKNTSNSSVCPRPKSCTKLHAISPYFSYAPVAPYMPGPSLSKRDHKPQSTRASLLACRVLHFRSETTSHKVRVRTVRIEQNDAAQSVHKVCTTSVKMMLQGCLTDAKGQASPGSCIIGTIGSLPILQTPFLSLEI